MIFLLGLIAGILVSIDLSITNIYKVLDRLTKEIHELRYK